MIDLLKDAIAEHLYRCLFVDRPYLQYVRKHRIDTRAISGFAGPTCAAMIADCGNGRFEIGDDPEAVPGFICLALDTDGETPLDLVAWPFDRPDRVLSMFGKCAMLGLWEATSAGTYAMGRALQMHKTPLDWLRSGCQGAAIVSPHLARWTLLEIPGPIASADHAHGRELLALTQSLINPARFIAPRSSQRAAA